VWSDWETPVLDKGQKERDTHNNIYARRCDLKVYIRVNLSGIRRGKYRISQTSSEIRIFTKLFEEVGIVFEQIDHDALQSIVMLDTGILLV
jgi:hypothetical protein